MNNKQYLEGFHIPNGKKINMVTILGMRLVGYLKLN